MQKLKSLTIFFPFYNDEGTVERQIHLAYIVGKRVARDLEIIAIHGGPSTDKTRQKLYDMKALYPGLKIINKLKNTQGYAVIKHGFVAATKDWIFYTDGDAQYHLETDLEKLVDTQIKTKADVVNGYKVKRSDPLIRTILGAVYAHLSRMAFGLPIRDIDCDFRLIKRSLMEGMTLESSDSSILAELIKKLQFAGAKFAEVSVTHYKRVWGSSNYNWLDLLREKLVGDIRLYVKIRKTRLKG